MAEPFIHLRNVRKVYRRGRGEFLAISDATFERAVSILTANRAVLEDGARQLLQKETLTEDEIGTIAVTLKRAA